MVNKKSENIYKKLGDKLKRAREEAGMTQADVAKMAGVQANFYARVERGEENPTYEWLARVQKVLKIESDLF